MKGEAGKGDTPRPRSISDREWALRYDLAVGRISRETFDRALARLREEKK